MNNKMISCMSKKLEKFLAFIIVVSILTVFVLPVTVKAQVGTVIHSQTEVTTVTSGVIHKTIKQFTSSGWLSINILQVDLRNQNIKLDALTNTAKSTKLTNVKTIAEENSAVAAVNANYYYMAAGMGNALGPVISNNEIVSMSNGFNTPAATMATFSLNSSNMPSIDYWKTNISITSPTTGAAQNVTNYNRMSNYNFKDIIILDKNFGKMSLGASAQYPDLLEMVVSGGIVKEIRVGQPPAEIPEDGFVAVSRSSATNFIIKNFQVGYPATIEAKSNIDWKNIAMAVSGSSVLVKNGKILSTFSFSDKDNAKRNPRTMVGSTKDGKTLFIVTVDGRHQASIGMTLAEAAKYMLEIGAYNALNLDGGGSTTMVTRPLGENSLAVDNVPSDSGMRGVTTALGIISTAPSSELAGLTIESEEDNVFVNTTRKLIVKGYDQYYNPVELPPVYIRWQVSGIKGTVVRSSSGQDFVFTPKEVGEAKITASIGKIKKDINISSLSLPVKIVLDKTSIKVPAGSGETFGITGYNANGYSAHINPADLHYNVVAKKQTGSEQVPQIGTVDNKGIFTANESGTGYIDAFIGKVHAYCAVSVMFSAFPLIDDFENETGRSFSTYPEGEGITGAYSLTQEKAYEGKSSCKLSYSFSDTQKTKAAYINLSNDGLLIQPGYEYVGVYVYNPKTVNTTNTGNTTNTDNTTNTGNTTNTDNTMNTDSTTNTDNTTNTDTGTNTGNMTNPGNIVNTDNAANADNLVKCEIVDKKGQVHYIDLSTKLDWTGWKYLQAPISGIESPARIIKLYVARVTAGASQGDIYFDKLMLTKNWYQTVEPTEVPKDTVPADPANIRTSFRASSTSFRFSVFGQSKEPADTLQSNLVKKMTSKINGSLETSAVVGNSQHTFTKGLKKQYIAAYKGFKSYTLKNSLFMQLDMSKGSLRMTDPTQWTKLQSQLSSTKAQNIFIFLAASPNSMKDQLEGKLLKDTLSDFKKATKKNVWVFFHGNENSSYMERGIKYISACGYDVNGLNSKTVSLAKYYQITVKGNAVTYELKVMND